MEPLEPPLDPPLWFLDSELSTCFLLKLKSSHLKVSIQLLMYTVPKGTIFLTLGIDILYRTMVMQLFSKDIINNVSVSFK